MKTQRQRNIGGQHRRFQGVVAVGCGLAVLLGSINQADAQLDAAKKDPFVLVLGVAQDAGYPRAGCLKDCCKPAWKDGRKKRTPTSIAIVDPVSKQRWLLDCSWQLPDQLHRLNQSMPRKDSPGIDGIFLTHGHIGHYTGLMHLGREVMGAKQVAVYAMPRMKSFLQKNGPWDLLVKLKNIDLKDLKADQTIKLNERLSIKPIVVPHRGEYTETVGFIVKGPNRSLLYLPDIDKWSRWETPVETVLKQVDIAFLDATFFADGEIPGRNMSQIPHPFVQESIARFRSLDRETRAKIRFIHLNHTNPALDPSSAAAAQIKRAGMNLAAEGGKHGL